MSGGQEKNFSTLGPKLRGNKAQQYYGDKQRQISIEPIDYVLQGCGILAFILLAGLADKIYIQQQQLCLIIIVG